jgi:uncharacterized protein
MGDCRLRAEAGRLDIALKCVEPDQLDRMEEVVAVHLDRFAFREPFEIAWSRDEAAMSALQRARRHGYT